MAKAIARLALVPEAGRVFYAGRVSAAKARSKRTTYRTTFLDRAVAEHAEFVTAEVGAVEVDGAVSVQIGHVAIATGEKGVAAARSPVITVTAVWVTAACLSPRAVDPVASVSLTAGLAAVLRRIEALVRCPTDGTAHIVAALARGDLRAAPSPSSAVQPRRTLCMRK